MLLCVLLLAVSAHSAIGSTHPKVIVVVANRLLLSDLEDSKLPTIHKMLRGGTVGLVSPNCAGPKTEASVLLTANAGSPAKGGLFVKEFYDASEPLPDGTSAGQAYAVRTGREAPAGSAVFLGLGQAVRENAKLNAAPARLGVLGDALHAAGLKTGIIGNADTIALGKNDQPLDRSAAVLAMDSRGIVDGGNINWRMFWMPGEPIDLPSPQDNTDKADLKIIDFGVFTFLDELRMSMSDAAFQAWQNANLTGLDILLSHALSREPAGTVFVLVSFSPPKGTAWDQLTPMVVYPTKTPGLLASATTRTPGVIGAADFAPTVLRLMRVSTSEEMIGRPATVVPNANAVAALSEMSARVTANQRGLTPIAVFIVALGALAFTPTALIVALGLKPSRRIVRLLKVGLVAGGTTFASLLLAVLAPAGAVWYAVGTAVSMVALTALCFGLAAIWRPQPREKDPTPTLPTLGRGTTPHPNPLPQGEREQSVRALPVVLVFGVTALIIVADALTGCNLCKWCGPSSYQITAMRFYGIGNEYAGVLIPTAALATLFSPCRKWLTPVVGIVTIVVLGLGNLGANYGGTAAAVVTFVLLWLAISRGGFGARHVALAFGLAIAAVVGFAVLDWALAGSAGSHAARATGLTEKLGGSYLANIAMRKVLFNLRITFSMAGLHYALAFVPFLALWFGGVQGKVRSAFKQDSYIIAGMKAVLIGAAGAFMLNDSGIVFAGIMIAITVLVLLYSLLEEQRAEGRELRAEGRPHPGSLHLGEGEGPHPGPPHLGEGEVG